jgi:hypothetical protein
MNTAPVVRLSLPPVVLPVFDPSWKDKCRACAHFQPYGLSEWRCRQVTLKDVRPKLCASDAAGSGWMRRLKGPAIGAYCIDAREEGAPCGPEARLWEARGA